MNNGMIFPPSYYREQDTPPECPKCGGPPTRSHDCSAPPAPRVVPPVERARRALGR